MRSIKQLHTILFNKEQSSGESLTGVVVKSSAISFVAKALTMIAGLVTMPIVYNALDKYQFGVYATLTSIISWIDLFDFGITQGLRNRLTEARADGDILKARRYISTSYVLLFLIAFSLFLVYCACSRFLNWQAILNADVLERNLLDRLAFLVFSFFLIRFVASVINKIYYAFQKSYLVDVTQLIGKIIYLLILVALSFNKSITLINVAVLQSAIAAGVPILAALYFFLFSEKEYKPSFKLVDFRITGQIMGLGWQFFVISLALLVIHSGNNLLISQFVDPASVPSYSLSYNLYSYVLLAYTIIITPLWSAYTEAWRKGDVAWIKTTMNRIKKIFFLFVVGCGVIVVASPLIFRIWIGEKADVPMIMAAAVAIMMLLDMWIRIYDFFINGVGKIRVQMIINIIMACLNIPLAYVFSVVLEMGAIGVVLASIISYGVSAIISPIQARMILDGTAKGIWNK